MYPFLLTNCDKYRKIKKAKKAIDFVLFSGYNKSVIFKKRNALEGTPMRSLICRFKKRLCFGVSRGVSKNNLRRIGA